MRGWGSASLCPACMSVSSSLGLRSSLARRLVNRVVLHADLQTAATLPTRLVTLRAFARFGVGAPSRTANV